MTRRISRGTPAMLTMQEQEQFINLLNASPGLQDSIEAVLNKKLAVMTYQEKVAAVHEFLEMGHSVAAIAQAAKAINDLRNLAGQARGDATLSDQNEALRSQLQAKADQISQAKARETELSDQITKLMDELTRARANPALAVHSTD